MEAVAMDKLIAKGGATPELARAIGEALDITFKAANLVTVPMLDARFAQCEAKMEARFSSLEKALESTKVWALLLYAGLVVVFFGALAADHHWLLNREDQFQAQSDAHFAAADAQSDAHFAAVDAHTDRLIAEDRARTDKHIADEDARTDRLIAEQQAHADQAQARMDAKFDQLRSLLLNRTRKP
jgi:hypothetical protein